MGGKVPFLDNALEAARAALDYLTTRMKSAGQRAADAFQTEAEKAESRAAIRKRRALGRTERVSKGGDKKPPSGS